MARKKALNPLAECMAEDEAGFVMTLPASLPGETAAHIADAILVARSHPLRMDASAVERIDTPCIQVLLSAARLWREDGMTMDFIGDSPVLEGNLNTLGLGAGELEVGDEKHD
jgi:chemotaxis protein CheX